MADREAQAVISEVCGRVASVVLAALLALGCGKTEEPKRDPSVTQNAPPAPSAAPSATFSPMLPQNQLRFVAAPKGADVAQVVKDEAAKQKALGRKTLVYVGATWCEPCKAFHHAAAKGELDAAFPDLTLVEFDADADGERLKAAGYTSRFIPLFALPSESGRSTGIQIEGSVKGDHAVSEITPRLRGLLARQP